MDRAPVGATAPPGEGRCSVAVPRDRLFQEWVKSWAEETGQGVPCMEAQADGVPCFELGRECEECEEAYEAFLRWRRAKGIVDGPVS